MKRQKNLTQSAAFAFLVWVAMTSGVYADGYRNPPPTAEGIGKSGVNMVFVDDASAISYNPANLAFQTNISVVVGAALVRSETTFNNSASGQAVSDDPWVALPNLYVSVPVSDGIVIGLGVTTPFGQGIKFDQNDLMNLGTFTNGFSPPIHEAEIGLVNFNPTIAFKVSDRIAIGVGADIYYSTLKFKQLYPWGRLGIPPGVYDEGDGNAEVEADGYGFGGNAAITWNATDRQWIALTYRSEVKVEYEGDFDINTIGPPVPPPVGDGSPAFAATSSSFSMDIKYPTVIGAGYGIELTDTIRVEANLEWLEWSVNDTQTADLGANGTDSASQDWDNTFTVGVGGDWQFADGWVARAGYAFIESPIPDETIAPILPDADRHVLSLGLGYTIKGHTLDLAYVFSIYEDRNNTGSPTAPYQGSYDIDSNLVGVTYSFSF